MTDEEKQEYEKNRLEALYSYNILDTLPDEEFDNLTSLAAEIAGTPVSMINLIDKHRQWNKSRVGLNSDMSEMQRSKSVCQYTIHDVEISEIKNLSADPRFADFDYVKEKGGLRYYLGVPLITEEKYAIGALCVLDYKVRDLNEQQKRQLRIITKQVMAHLKLHKQNRELQALNDYKVKLMKMLSHDMRSPLNGIIGLSGMLKEMNALDNTEHLDLLNIIEQSSTQLNQMIDEMMNYTIIESDGLKLEIEETNLLKRIEDISKLYKPAAKLKQINLEFYTENIDRPLRLDGNKFDQIVGNLLSNAIKYTKTGGFVKLSLICYSGLKGDSLELIVADNGVGIKEGDVADLLAGNKINSSSEGTDGEKSNGIGLSIIEHFVNLFSGEMKIKSNLGEGSQFIIRIPL